MRNNQGLEQLIYIFSKLPGLGARSARRIVFHLLSDKDIRLRSLIESLSDADKNIKNCTICDNFDVQEICSICTDDNRSDKIIAIVESVADLMALERSKTFTGRYHILGMGNISVGKNPDDLKLDKLSKRCQDNNTSELIIATNATLDGQTTAYYITEFFKDSDIKITRLASGIPIGGELDYLDEGTLEAAMAKRTIF